MKRHYKNFIKDQRGNMMLTIVFSMIALLGAASLTLDLGYAYISRVELSNGIDAAALAGAMELPNNPTQANAVAVDYLARNGIDPADAQVSIAADHMSISIKATKQIQNLFAPLIGIDTTTVGVENEVAVGPLGTAESGIRPIAVETFPYAYGERIVLKEDGGDGYHGNYGVVNLGGFGTAVVKENILYGYKGALTVGDMIYTKTGVISAINQTVKDVISADSSTFETFSRGSARVWTVPIVDSLVVDGSKPVKILGFAQFYIENVKNGPGGQTELTGRFVRYVGTGEIDFSVSEAGALGVKLMK